MIQKINKIKNLGIFSKYQWDSGKLNNFQRYNLFYWWNGSGKTTLTKLFSILEKWESPEFPDLEYEIECENGVYKNWQAYSTEKIRVFNQEYIENNIEMVGSKAKPIFILWAENKALAEQIEKDEWTLKSLLDLRKTNEDLRMKLEKDRWNKFTDVAKIIGANASGSSLRNYRKPEAEKAFSLLQHKQLLDESKVSEYLLVLKQEEKSKIEILDGSEVLKDISFLVKEGQILLKDTIKSRIIERLQKNNDISLWVEAGLALHLDHLTDTCEFCMQKIPDSRISDLNQYFNEQYKILKGVIDGNLVWLKEAIKSIESISVPDKANFYTELQTEYTSRVTTFNKEKINLINKIFDFINLLEEKKTKTSEELLMKIDFDNNFESSLLMINSSIKVHNDKTTNFQTQKDESQKKLEFHYLSEIYDEINTLDTNINNYNTVTKKLDEGDSDHLWILRLSETIRENKSLISSEHKACELLNNNLETFLWRKEILFEVSPDGWYIIKRNNKIAKNLSEWEKTAIAFIYFVVHLEDSNFKLKDGIVVIDDPISSLDSNSLFQAFSFLKNSIQDAKQVFMLTHNFDFLKLILGWLKHAWSSNYYMICNVITNDERMAQIDKLDNLLTTHETEYHYLCKILFRLEIDGTIASVYHIPNVARKVLDTFLMFRIPNWFNLYKKLEVLNFDKNKKTAIYKFTNDQSHITGKWFDSSLVPETQKNIKYLFEMMEAEFPEHYRILRESIPVT